MPMKRLAFKRESVKAKRKATPIRERQLRSDSTIGGAERTIEKATVCPLDRFDLSFEVHRRAPPSALCARIGNGVNSSGVEANDGAEFVTKLLFVRFSGA